jgi:glycosyltransferase involved in cell wall biosynthesis
VKIHVVVPAYNCMDFLPACLDSIAQQTRPADTVTIIDDASTDPEQARFIQTYCSPLADWRVVLNETNLEAAHNIWNAHTFIDPAPDDVIVELDGDDRLTPNALERIAAEYADPDVWLTYGSYEYWPDPNHWDNPALPYPPDVVAARTYRTHRVLFNHPETWRAFLWSRLTPADLQDNQGRWIRRTWDYAAMMPLLEMAGTHWRHIPDVLYLYTHKNPLSHVRSPEHQADADHEAAAIRGRQPRLPIPDDHIANPRRKRDMLARLADDHVIVDVVETGSGVGDLTEWLRHAFRNVYTVELDPRSYETVRDRFAAVRNVHPWRGHSADYLSNLVTTYPVLFFLDAHYSGPGTARGDDGDTPVLVELKAIYRDGQDHVVVIDDARLFGTDPAYPTPIEVGQAVSPRRVTFADDMIIIQP